MMIAEVCIMEKVIYLAGGCFWGTQKIFEQFDGIKDTEAGYANGPEGFSNPTYKDVCNDSGHAETVKIVYDDSVISLTQILGYYFMIIDPTSVNRQGEDEGIQYRTGIYYIDEAQLPEINKAMKQESDRIGKKLAVEVKPLKNFWLAEEYHQNYLDKNPKGYCHVPLNLLHIADGKKG